MKFPIHIYVAYFAYFADALKKRGIDSGIAEKRSRIFLTLIALLQIHLCFVSVHYILDRPVNFLLYSATMLIFTFYNLRYLKSYKVLFGAQLGFQNFDDDDKLMMTIYLRVLLIIDIILLLTFINVPFCFSC